jgi:hypothetical protein
MRRTLMALFALALIFGTQGLWDLKAPAFAASPPSPPGNTLNTAMVGVPIVSGGRLVNYVLVRLTLVLKPGTDASRLVEKEPYFREALVRLGYHIRLNPPNSLNTIDPALVSSKMLPLCQAITGGNLVTGVQIKYQEPARWLPPPTPAPNPAAAPEPRLEP